MPCSDGGPPAGWEEEQRERLDTTTRLACKYCKLLEAEGLPIPEWAKVWWITHQREDAERIKREEASRKRREKIEAAKSKLTKEEKKLLGLR